MERREIRENVFQTEYDVLIVGAGVAGMNCAMHLPTGFRVLMISKGGLRESDSYLAQGGICVLRDPEDFDGYFEDTMRAGHYENDPATVRCYTRARGRIPVPGSSTMPTARAEKLRRIC